MQVKRYQSTVSGMMTWRIVADDGRIYPIDKDYHGRLFAVVAHGWTVVDVATRAPFSGMTPDREHATITALLKNARARDARQAKHDAYTSCGLVRVKGALGGTYYE